MPIENENRIEPDFFPIRLRLRPHKLPRDQRRIESQYLQDLEAAREAFGHKSAYVGVVLLQLQEFYERNGMNTAAEKVEKEARRILCAYGEKMSINSGLLS